MLLSFYNQKVLKDKIVIGNTKLVTNGEQKATLPHGIQQTLGRRVDWPLPELQTNKRTRLLSR